MLIMFISNCELVITSLEFTKNLAISNKASKLINKNYNISGLKY